MGEFGSELTRWMQARDTGVRALARRAGYTASYISQLRAGKRMPSPEAAADLDDALSAGGELAASAPAAARASGRPVTRAAGPAGEIAAILAALPGDGQRGLGALRDQEYDHLVQALAHWAADMKRRDVLAILGAAATAACASPLLDRLSPDEVQRMTAAAAGTRRADPAVAAHAEAVLDHCMRQEDALGPQVVLDTVLAQQRLVTSLLAGASGGVHARLLPLLANICRFTGWVLYNLNDYDGAGYYYGQARAAAHEADDDAMCAMVLANWSQLATWAGDPRLGVEHALGAVAWGQRAGSWSPTAATWAPAPTPPSSAAQPAASAAPITARPCPPWSRPTTSSTRPRTAIPAPGWPTSTTRASTWPPGPGACSNSATRTEPWPPRPSRWPAPTPPSSGTSR